MNYFFDNNISPKIARALNFLCINDHVIHLRDKFKGNTDDAVWIRELGKDSKNWIIISGDKAILSKLHEQEALIKSGCTIFVFDKPFQNKDFWTQTIRIITIWQEIKALSKQNEKESIFRVPMSGKKINKIR